MLIACVFFMPTLSAVEKWHNPEGSGARVVQGQAFFGKITSGGATSIIDFRRQLRAMSANQSGSVLYVLQGLVWSSAQMRIR